MRVFEGTIRKVLTEEQYQLISTDMLNSEEVKFKDTVRINDVNNKFLPFRIAYKEVDHRGNCLRTYDEYTGKWSDTYRFSPIIYAFGESIEVLLKIGEMSNVKVVSEQIELEEGMFVNKVIHLAV